MTVDKAWSHEIPAGDWDYVVIGSGMGGMTAAGILAKLGKRVLVLERHLIPGGFTQTFKRPGYRWDVGVHIIGEMTDRSYPGRLLKDLSGGLLEWESVGQIYDEFNFPDGFTIQFPDSRQAFRETLLESFPDEAQAIDEYLELVRRGARATAKYFQMKAVPVLLGAQRKKATSAASWFLAQTLSQVLDSLTDNERLKAVLSAQWGYYGATPDDASFAMHALMVTHFMYGAHYPVGGAGRIAETMLAQVAEVGGWTAVRRSVEEILVEGGRVVGVRLSDGTEVKTKRVISTAGGVQTAAMLKDGLPGTAEASYRTAGVAHVSLYLGFKGDIESAGANRWCQWYYDQWDMEVSGWDVDPDQPIGSVPVLFCSFPSLKDPAHEPGEELRHTGEAITFVPWESFERWEGSRWKKRSGDYESFKAALTERLLADYLEHYPELEPMIDYVELSTPLTTAHFTDAFKGSIYGLGTEPDRFIDETLGPKTALKGLYLGGQDAAAPGVVGALSGGALAALAAEPVKALRYIAPIMKG